MWPGSVASGFSSSSLHLSAEVVKALMGEELTEEELLKVGCKPCCSAVITLLRRWHHLQQSMMAANQ